MAKHFDIKVAEDRAFIAELSALESFLDALSRLSHPLDSQYAAGHLVGLETLYYKYGAHSDQYAAGVKAMHTSLSTLYHRLSVAQHNSRLFVSLLPPVQRHHSSSILKRWEENEIAFGDIHAAPVLEGFTRSTDPSGLGLLQKSNKPGLGGCYDSQSACEADTNDCTGHGSCQKYLDQENCYQCVCAPTIKNVTSVEGGKKTTNWAGASCAKKDISFEFQVFFWFVITMVATVWWSVKLLYSVEIGSGGVLAATGYINRGATSAPQ